LQPHFFAGLIGASQVINLEQKLFRIRYLQL